jgi:cysteine desulfurase
MSTYLDCNATTPIEPAVLEIVIRFMERDFGNAASPIHDYGTFALMAVDHARAQIAEVVGARRDEVVFTSGATEANNLAILGLAEFGLACGRRHVIGTRIEHKAVLEPLEELESRGFEVTLLEVDRHGRIRAEQLAEALRPDTLLVSTMHVNNETGVLQPLPEISSRLAGHRAFWHVDAAQGFGKEIDCLRDRRIDLISISGHKIYGPKGIGALIARKREKEFPPLRPLQFGGGQEQGLRPGTLPVPLIAGLGAASRLALRGWRERAERCRAYREQVLSALASLDAVINSPPAYTLPHVVNVSFPGIPAETAITALREVIAVSSTSACTSHLVEPSHVLAAMGLPDELNTSAIRLSWCHMTEDADWETVINILKSLGESKYLHHQDTKAPRKSSL